MCSFLGQGNSRLLFTPGSWGQLRKVTWLAWQDSCSALSSSGIRVSPENMETKEIGLELQLRQKC